MHDNRRLSVPAAYGPFALITLVTLAYGLQYRFLGESHVAYFRLATIPFVLVLAGLTWHAAASWQRGFAIARRHDALGAVFMSASFLLTVYFHSADLSPAPWPLIGAGVVAAAWAGHLKWGARGSTLVFLACMFALYAYLVYRVPHCYEGGPDCGGANMLKIVEEASKQFLAGNQPYRLYAHVAEEPFFYLPGLWLPYAALVKLGIDVRVFNLMALAAIVLIFEKALPIERNRATILSLTLYPLLLSHPFLGMVLRGHMWPYWLLLCLTMLALVRHRYSAAALLFGLTLASRQSALLIAGPLAVYLYSRVGLKGAARLALLAAVPYALVVLPFALWRGDGFWALLYLKFTSMTPDMLLTLPQIGMGSYLAALGATGAMTLIQAAIVLFFMAWVALRAERGDAWLLYVVGLTYVWAVMFNPYVVRYLYFSGLLVLVMGMALHLGQRRDV